MKVAAFLQVPDFFRTDAVEYQFLKRSENRALFPHRFGRYLFEWQGPS
jgi:hypothetical protein